MVKIKVDYDRQSDSLFIYCVDKYVYDVSLELDKDVIIDFVTQGIPVAFEFLNASKFFRITKNDFNNILNINIESNINEKEIHLNVNVLVSIRNESIDCDVNRVTSNLSNIPECTSILATA